MIVAPLQPDHFRSMLQAVQKTAAALAKPFSLCQLPWTEEDRNWLRTWPDKVSASRLDAALEEGSYTGPESAGLALLLVATEVGREYAVSGEIWPVVRERFPESLRQVVFSGKHPRQKVCHALESACRCLQLRHAFGREGVHAYYLTIYLQFGFGRQSLARLPQWLESAASRPRSVTVLLNESEEFRELWDALGAWVKGQAKPELLRRLRNSSFIPEEWLPVLEAAEASRPTIGVRYSWSGANPEAVLELDALFPDAPAGAYFLTLHGGTQLVTREGGRFEPDQWSCPLADSPRVTLSLEPIDGSSAPLSETVILWDAEADYVLLDPARGQRLRKTPRSPFWLLCRADFEGREAARWSRLGKNWKLYEYGGPPQESPFLFGPEGPVDLDAAPSCSPLAGAELDVLDRVAQRLPCKTLATIRGLRVPFEKCRFFFRGQPLPGELDPALGFPELPLELPLELESTEVAVQVRCSFEGRGYTATLRHPVQVRATTWQSPSGWAEFRDLEELEAADLSQRPVRLFYPADEWAVTEGNLIVCRTSGEEQILPLLGGYGQPLALRSGPFAPKEEDVVLASSVVYRGRVKGLQLERGSFRMLLRRPHQPDGDSFLIWWDGASRLCLHDLSDCAVRSDSIRGPIPLDFRGVPFVVALGYRSARLGTYWSGVLEPPELAIWPQMAAAARWFHLPLLAPAWWEVWGPRLRTNAVEVLSTWIEGGEWEVEGRKLLAPERAEFGEVLRQVADAVELGVTVPSAQVAQKRAERLLEAVPLSRWVRTAPRFATRLLDVGARRAWRGVALATLFGLENARDLEPLCQSAAQALGVDPHFVRRLADEFLRGSDASRLELALTQSAFGDYAVARWLLES